MTEIWQGVKSERNEPALRELAARARRDLELLNIPGTAWVPETIGPDGKPMIDVLVVGAGMCGQSIAFALMREGVRNVRVIDRCARGEEGPWGTYARMEILRSPKTLTGPDLGIPSLTFRAWYEAQHGADGWARLHKAGRIDWRDYLLWVRDTVGVSVENGTELVTLEPGANGVRAELVSAAGRSTVWARKVVLAGGRDGAGGPRTPTFPGLANLPEGQHPRVLHTCQPMSGEMFLGRRVGVLGGGASGFDCAATALEGRAAEVTMFLRRPHLPQVNKSKWTSFPGFLRGFSRLSDQQRWDIFTYIFGEQVPPPYESVLRCDSHAAFSIRFGEGWQDVRPAADHVAVVTPRGTYRYDQVILGTGFDVDLTMRPELAGFRDNIQLWSDRVGAEAAAKDRECGRFPYLGAGFQFLPREESRTPGLDRIHMFSWGVTMTHGALAGDIPGLAIGVNRLTEALVSELFAADLDRHLARLDALDERELAPTRRLVP